jgi:hypothetical protein
MGAFFCSFIGEMSKILCSVIRRKTLESNYPAWVERWVKIMAISVNKLSVLGIGKAGKPGKSGKSVYYDDDGGGL